MREESTDTRADWKRCDLKIVLILSGIYILAISTLPPMAMPLKKPTTKKIRFPEELTAARALLPRKLPTIRESTVLYNC